MERRLFRLCILLFFIPKLLDTYFLMPFPGSMDQETMTFSFYLNKIADPLLYISGIFLLWGIARIMFKGSLIKKAGAFVLLVLCLVFGYYTLIEFRAEKMFREPASVVFKKASREDYAGHAFVIGVLHNGEAKAYPLRYLAYHHKIEDSIGGQPALVTYCSMCRSARVFKPEVEHSPVHFRLVGARHYNAVIEDSKTGTWWYQATGEAAAGPLKGQLLDEIPFEQTTWKAWYEKHPETLLLQPDPGAISKYREWFEGFDDMRSPPVSPEQTKTWVLGIKIHDLPKAYFFPDLLREKLIEDKTGPTPLLITIENDSLTTHVWFRSVNNHVTHFVMDSAWNGMRDTGTGSFWNMQGLCTEGVHKGARLFALQHYQEYLRSWKRFHPNSTYWKAEDAAP